MPGSQASLREANRARTLAVLRRLGPLTQVEVARATGLSPATVSNIVKELSASGVLQVERTTSSGGRRASRVSLSRSLGVAVGVDFGHRHLSVAVGDLAHEVLGERRVPLPAEHRWEEGLDLAAGLVEELVREAGGPDGAVLAVGLGLPGPVDADVRGVGSPTLLPGWVGVDVVAEMSRRTGAPVHVDNDANLGALAEWHWGAARGQDDVVYLKLAHGVGAGLVIGGRLFRGRRGTAGEFGHTTIDEAGRICRCGGRGCLETYVRAGVLVDMLRASHGPVTLAEVVQGARDGDPGCRRVVSDAGRHVGVALASLCNLLDPERVVVGGELATAGDVLLDPLREVVHRVAIHTGGGGVEVVAAELGERAEVLGALALALEQSAGVPVG
ncbi:MarR family transcriptional regulator [Motilibacter rhizosphaerae]|uniref:MarR family transcriptional regulator n=1 Tax=Motilibacter rhizosphaerae TaxID=598652 RepID=A0A4Q7NRC0_9ACTN|nr:MarR family transcriptional regulator [Motilibacter rhizosphaerae]